MNNQCDGCMKGDTIINGLHIALDGKPYMVCCKKDYRIRNIEYVTLNNINDDLECVDSVEHSRRLKLQAFGYCRLSSNNGIASFDTDITETFWHLTELGYEAIGETNDA